ncbi:MSHA biogenesis protein MshI [Alteromonas sp. 5E99-2]|nr:MSHA biogenesis protein MshI [Alteromonas sp. 5E99-2]
MSIGIAIQSDATIFCILKKDSDGSVVLHNETIVSDQDWGKALKKWAIEQNVNCTPVFVAFSIDYYQQFQLDKPNVEAEEVVSALAWSVNELTDSNTSRAIDYTDLPVPLAGNDKVNVVSVNDKDMHYVVESVISAGLPLESISVEEVVTCNFLLEDPDAVITLIQDGSPEICLNIVKQGKLYFSRRLKGFENLGSFTLDELKMGIIDSLCVQIQRSMDYFESQLRQAPVRQLRLKLDTQHLTALIEQIEQALPVKVSSLPHNIILPDDLKDKAISYTALGAALGAVLTEEVKR